MEKFGSCRSVKKKREWEKEVVERMRWRKDGKLEMRACNKKRNCFEKEKHRMDGNRRKKYKENEIRNRKRQFYWKEKRTKPKQRRGGKMWLENKRRMKGGEKNKKKREKRREQATRQRNEESWKIKQTTKGSKCGSTAEKIERIIVCSEEKESTSVKVKNVKVERVKEEREKE